MKRILAILSLAASLACAIPSTADELKLNDGDRVVLLGSTLIEREQKTGYWETALTIAHPDRNILTRNLGWSGDTVFGQARASFGSTADGFRHLKEHVASIKPTVILIQYGTNEAFEGEAGIPNFQKGLATLLDALAPLKARIVLISPLRQEDMGRPLPDPTAQNKNIKLYRDVLKKVAGERGYPFIDLSELPVDLKMSLTDNGMHPTPFGYWKTASAISPATPRWEIDIDAQGKVSKTEGAKVEAAQAAPLRFQATDATLPTPVAPSGKTSAERVLRVQGLSPGKYSLTIDGQDAATATAEEWAKGVKLERGAEFDQVEKLRAAIVEKNTLYFYRWRPQNETYLFGFRKAEQGKNAKEVPEFDPLVKKMDAEIAKLRVPVPHKYELIPQGK